jgi:ureidoacrylate peracid hydrolase
MGQKSRPVKEPAEQVVREIRRASKSLSPGDFGHALYRKLEVAEGDLRVCKTRFSALIQGSSDLDAVLRARGIDTLIIVGTATNVCCESTARDAMMLNTKYSSCRTRTPAGPTRSTTRRSPA